MVTHFAFRDAYPNQAPSGRCKRGRHGWRGPFNGTVGCGGAGRRRLPRHLNFHTSRPCFVALVLNLNRYGVHPSEDSLQEASEHVQQQATTNRNLNRCGMDPSESEDTLPEALGHVQQATTNHKL
jgi:hypothetical protein